MPSGAAAPLSQSKGPGIDIHPLMFTYPAGCYDVAVKVYDSDFAAAAGAGGGGSLPRVCCCGPSLFLAAVALLLFRPVPIQQAAVRGPQAASSREASDAPAAPTPDYPTSHPLPLLPPLLPLLLLTRSTRCCVLLLQAWLTRWLPLPPPRSRSAAPSPSPCLAGRW